MGVMVAPLSVTAAGIEPSCPSKVWTSRSMASICPWERELPWENVQLKQRPGDRAAEIAVQGADAIREYRAFYRLPCTGFPEKELDAWARGRWNWGTRPDAPQVWRGGEILFGALLSGIGLERGAVSWAGVYELLHRLNLPVRGRPERFTALGADAKKPIEVYVNYTNKDGTLWYGGWYHLCGTLLSEGEELWQVIEGKPRRVPEFSRKCAFPCAGTSNNNCF